jgi:hypothetical protein
MVTIGAFVPHEASVPPEEVTEEGRGLLGGGEVGGEVGQ